jgi:hypothetical protein
MNFVKYVIEKGGYIKPLMIPPHLMVGSSLTNPSVMVVDKIIIVNLRNTNYTLYHSELNRFEHKWGPLSYIHPENDMHLRTANHITYLDNNLDIIQSSKIDTSNFDTYEPKWEFIGLEDARLINWNGKNYAIGVRRDLDIKGTGRMELSELEFDDKYVKEISRYRIPGPPPDNEYCMKNCTPIEGMPYHLLKWTNPTTLMRFNPDGSATDIIETESFIPGYNDMRGGSQVIKIDGGYITIIHETQLYNSEQGRKDATYRHRFVIWNDNFQIKHFSPLFSFLNMKIEFCCGMASFNDDWLITFGAQDNSAYILRVSKKVVEDFIYEPIIN